MTAHVHLYDRNASVAHIHLRLFEPRAFSFAKPVFGVPALIKFRKATPCLVCDAEDVPGATGWVECFGDRRLFTLCGACADTPSAELEQHLLDKLGLVSAEIAVAAE
jgi:hypothetical protein